MVYTRRRILYLINYSLHFLLPQSCLSPILRRVKVVKMISRSRLSCWHIEKYIVMVTFTLWLLFLDLVSLRQLSCYKYKSINPQSFTSKKMVKRSSEYIGPHIKVLPTIPSQVYSDSKLTEGKGYWYVQNGMNIDRLVLRGDIVHKNKEGNTYARGLSGVWYVFKQPPTKFLDYFEKLPFGRRILFDGKDCYVLSRKGTFEKLVKRSEKVINNKIRVYAEDGQWYSIKNLSNAFTKAAMNLPLTKLPLGQVLRVEDTYEMKLVKANGSWFVNNGSFLDRLVQQGDGRGWKGMLYLRGKTGKWYRFLHPPKEFRDYVEKELEVRFDEARFSQVGEEWYLHHSNQYSKIVKRGEIFDNKKLYVVTENGRWHRVVKCDKTAQIIDALLKLPITEDTFQNYQLRSSNSNRLWQILIKNKLRNFTAHGDITIYVRTSSKKWYRLRNPLLQVQNYLERLSRALNIAPFSELDHRTGEISQGPTHE